eukprot:TRINITY_DN12932_c0_g1_i1.p3 TRINITY_DN12932_c0_g1~~TRINITY_DN12932_c0_g1_i1.p3  ORF type:complete len:132 (+),score=41.01 TRINITY_DN12932_c0_g1_i1:80-475(+)
MYFFFFFLMIRRPPRSTQGVSSAASDVYKRQVSTQSTWGAGGHNGVKSIIENMGTDQFGRIKIGIGRPEKREQVTSYVLHDFDKNEIEVIENGIEKAAEAAEEIILSGYTACMNNFNKQFLTFLRRIVWKF